MPTLAPAFPGRKSLFALAGTFLLSSLVGCASQSHHSHQDRLGIQVTSTTQAHLLAHFESAGKLFPEACKGWRLNRHQVGAFFAMAQEYADTASTHFDHLPCEMSGELLAEGERWQYRINAAGTASWQRNGQTRHFACIVPACEPLLLMLPLAGDV